MSSGTLKADSYTDSAGTGAPTATYGFKGGATYPAYFDAIVNSTNDGPPSLTNGIIDIGVVAALDTNTTFTNKSNRSQTATPTAPRIFTLPTTGIKQGELWFFYNQSTNVANYITLNASGGTTVTTVPPNGFVLVKALQDTPTTSAHWLLVNRKSGWVSWTPTLGAGFGTTSGVSGYYYVDFYSVIGKLNFTTGTIAASAATFTIPSFLTIATTVPNSTTTASAQLPGAGSYTFVNTNNSGRLLVAPGTSTSLVYFGAGFSSGSGQLAVQNGSGITASSTTGTMDFNIAITA